MGRSNWRLAGEILVVVFTIIAGLSALGIWLYPGFDPFGVKEGKFVAPDKKDASQLQMPHITLVSNRSDEPEFFPYGDGLPTAVSFQNKGGGECLIQSVEFAITKHRKTTKRVDSAGAMPAISINFKKNHYVKKDNRFKLNLKTPRACPQNEWATLKVAIVEPDWVGNTYLGNVTVTYNHNKTITLKNVELDVLAKEPSEKTK